MAAYRKYSMAAGMQVKAADALHGFTLMPPTGRYGM
jgi:cytochrome c5